MYCDYLEDVLELNDLDKKTLAMLKILERHSSSLYADIKSFIINDDRFSVTSRDIIEIREILDIFKESSHKKFMFSASYQFLCRRVLSRCYEDFPWDTYQQGTISFPTSSIKIEGDDYISVTLPPYVKQTFGMNKLYFKCEAGKAFREAEEESKGKYCYHIYRIDIVKDKGKWSLIVNSKEMLSSERSRYLKQLSYNPIPKYVIERGMQKEEEKKVISLEDYRKVN